MIMDDNYEELAGRQQCEAGRRSRDTDEASSCLIIEGDIQVDRSSEVNPLEGEDAKDVVERDEERRWPNGKIPYEISEKVRKNKAMHEKVRNAISQWQSATEGVLKFEAVENEKYPDDYVEFIMGEGCSSFVGRKEGRQTITLSKGCSYGNVLHEIGHTIGLYHTNARNDRDYFIEVFEANVEDEMLGQFKCQVKNGIDVLGYDYDSVMHYPAHAFGREENGKRAVTIKTRGGQPIGQRKYLSYGDIAAVVWMYRSDDDWIAGSAGRYDSLKVEVRILKSGKLRLIKEVDDREIRREFIECNSILKSWPTFVYDSKNDSTVIFVVAGEASRDVLQFTKQPTGEWESTHIATSNVALIELGKLSLTRSDLHGQTVLFATTADGGVAKIAKGQVTNLGGPPPNYGNLLCFPSSMLCLCPRDKPDYHIFLVGEGGRLLHLNVVDSGDVEGGPGCPSIKWTDLGFPHRVCGSDDHIVAILELRGNSDRSVFTVKVANGFNVYAPCLEVKYFFNHDPSKVSLEVKPV